MRIDFVGSTRNEGAVVLFGIDLHIGFVAWQHRFDLIDFIVQMAGQDLELEPVPDGKMIEYTILERKQCSMANKRKQFTPEFKQSAIDFVNAHPEMTVLQCANHLEIGLSTLQRWKREAKENPGQPVPFVGSGNYSSEIEKENIRLQKELRDTQEALKILKKAISILGN